MTAVEQELIELEHKYWQALKEQDVQTATEMTDDPCIVTGAQGVASIGKEQFAAMMQEPTWTINDFSLSDVSVRKLSDDVAIVAYKVREDLTVEGKPVTLEAADASTWIRQGNRWVCALHTESLSGDPFGRDRAQRVG